MRLASFELRGWWAHVALALLLACGVARGETAEECQKQFKAQAGQPGKDVIWLPTSDGLVTRMLELAQVRNDDLVYDLGSGDGKIPIAAAKQFGARAVGVEYNPELAKLGECLARVQGVADRVRIIQGDIFETDFRQATVVTLYLLPDLNLKLRPTLLKMKPGTRVVSHSFLMDDWEPDDRTMGEDGAAYLWIVPATVEGRWEFRAEKGGSPALRVQLEQKFQQLSGTVGEERRPLSAATLRGSNISLSFDERGQTTTLAGTLENEHITAEATRGGETTRYVGRRVR